ncbi:MAG: hypothetical protein OSB64_03235 [Candidatus Marinimicrobia bacterium]|nr:hypothetical protein [Candidatus Neomarinimicrobiota bacterium]
MALITAEILLSGCSISTATDYENELLTFIYNDVEYRLETEDHRRGEGL